MRPPAGKEQRPRYARGVPPAFRAATLAAAFVLALAGCTWPGPAAPPADQGSTLEVTFVADGDTLTGVDAQGNRTRVRLLGIDAPEVARDGGASECGAERSADALHDLVDGRTVTLTPDPVADAEDRFGRVLAYVTLEGRDVALAQVAAGMAEAWYPSSEPQPTRFSDYRRAEKTARAARTGLWGECSRVGR